MKCPKCGFPVIESDRFCTQCGMELNREVGQSVVSARQTQHRGLIAVLISLAAVVATVAIVLSLMAFHVVPNVLQKPRKISFKISAPHYSIEMDSKIPIHITGKTSSGKPISQHVYVSPQAPSVKLDPGQYTIQVEASPVLSSGDVYRIPEPIKIDTTKNANFVGESKPVEQNLKFEVKPANEVTASDLESMAKFAKLSKAPEKKLSFLETKIARQKVATAFNRVLDMLSTNKFTDTVYGSETRAEYSLLDIDQDGTPEMMTWFGVNGDTKLASDDPVGCGDENQDFSGNRIWKYDAQKQRAFCMQGPELPTPIEPDKPHVPYHYSSSERTLSIWTEERRGGMKSYS